MNPNKIQGDCAENKACQYVIDKGWEVLTRNFVCRGAELDLIAKKDNVIAIIEVKYRRSHTHQKTANTALNRALLSINRRKQQTLIRGAHGLLEKFPQYHAYTLRFDLIAVTLNSMNAYNCQWVINIFNLTDMYDA